MANFPTTLWDLNVQDTSNDGVEDATIAQAGGYNEAANEMGAVQAELGVATGAGNSLKGTAASLLARLAVSLNKDGSFNPQIEQITVTTALLTSMNCAIVSDVGSAGAPSTRPANLPVTVGGLQYFFVISDSGAGIRIVAPGGVKIMMGGRLSASGGYVESTDPGANIALWSISATRWVAIGPNGIWNLDGA